MSSIPIPSGDEFRSHRVCTTRPGRRWRRNSPTAGQPTGWMEAFAWDRGEFAAASASGATLPRAGRVVRAAWPQCAFSIQNASFQPPDLVPGGRRRRVHRYGVPSPEDAGDAGPGRRGEMQPAVMECQERWDGPADASGGSDWVLGLRGNFALGVAGIQTPKKLHPGRGHDSLAAGGTVPPRRRRGAAGRSRILRTMCRARIRYAYEIGGVRCKSDASGAFARSLGLTAISTAGYSEKRVRQYSSGGVPIV